MTENPLARIYRETGPCTWVYTDASTDVPHPRGMAAERRRSIRDALAEAGAPRSDIDAIEEVLAEPLGVANPACRYLLVRNGEVELDEILPGLPVTAEVAASGPVPDLVPLLRHDPSDVAYLVALVGRDGGELTVYQAGTDTADHHEAIEGSTDDIQRVSTGGVGEARYRRHSENVWQHNMEDVASAIDKLVRDVRPRLVVVAGDGQAVAMLRDQLGADALGMLRVVESNVRPDGASDASVQAAVRQGLDELASSDRRAALDHLLKRSGQDSAFGVGAVVTALQQAQADALLLDPEGFGGRTLLALGAEPWVATAPEDTLDAAVLAEVPADVALVRAAVIGDAAVHFVRTGEIQDAGAAASLRWPTGPAMPGSE